MVTVETDGEVVERRLVAGELSCLGCGGVLAGWGWARPRRLRGADGPVRLCPRRSRCSESGDCFSGGSISAGLFSYPVDESLPEALLRLGGAFELGVVGDIDFQEHRSVLCVE